ncbi:MAG: autotransporter assembly complex family protein [Hyphomonadaceae bacterium]|nr:autotransporter assembly complex family protein [Hyphomonadaceae bacterium]
MAALGAVAAPGAAHADTPVTIEGPDRETREAILDLLPDREQPASLFEAERIAEEAAARARAWLRSEGYYAAEVRAETQEDPVRAHLVISLGSRFRFAAPEIVFVGEPPSDNAAAAARYALSPIEAGAAARSADVLLAEGGALTALQNAGYADASAGERRVVVDHATGQVTAHFTFTAGALTRLGDLRAEPNDVLRPGFVEDIRGWTPGDSYTPQRLAELRRNLIATGVVSRATTRLAEPKADGSRDVILDIEPAKRNAYEVGLGYSTTEGIGVDAEWTRRNFTRRADSLTLSSSLGELRQSLAAEWARPHAAGIGHTQRLNASVSREDTDAYIRQGVAIGASVDADTRLSLGVSYGAQLSADWYDEAGGVRDAIVLTTFGEVRKDTRDSRFDPHDGSYVALRLEPSVSTGDASLVFARTTAEGRIYESVLREDRLTLAARARVGWLEALEGDPDDAPPDRRFYAGGGGSVRGYEYNSIYPEERDALDLTPGGQGLVETSVEARWRFGDRFGAVAFLDGGAAFDDWGEATDLRWGAGIGARYNLGFAPLRVDLAAPLDPRDSDPDYALYISIGQAF